MGKTSHFLALRVNISKTVRDLTSKVNDYWEIACALSIAPRSMTLDYPELI